MKTVVVKNDTKSCSQCSEIKSLTEFHKSSKHSSGRASACKPCASAVKKTWNSMQVDQRKARYEGNREAILDSQRLTTYGVTREQYDEMHRAQGGVCACCGQPERMLNRRGEIKMLAVDHDHSCCPGKKSCGGCVRGLLCHSCNVGLGIFGDSPELLMKAVQYLTAQRVLCLTKGA